MRNKEGLFEGQREQYRDFHFAFKRNPINGDLITLNTEDSIRQSVKLLVLTMFYERPFKPRIGTRLYGALFELWSVEMVLSLQTELTKFLNQYEPRIRVQSVEVGGEESLDSNELAVRISYLIEGKIKAVQQDIYVKRIR